MKVAKEKPAEILKLKLLQLLKTNNIDEIPNDIPTKWEKHGDLVLIPFHSLRHVVWIGLGSDVWDTIAESLKCSKVARKHKVENDDFRSPCTELLRGSDGWVVRVDNGIKCTFDVTKCMFSAGNISEKLRIAKFACEHETVVDLYAGIGYFTLPFLVHAKAIKVHACEWNPYAVEALERNLVLNGVKERCVIHFGDNRKVCPSGVADRVNLGLIPSCESGWKTACSALKPTTGGILHVHEVVTSNLKMCKSICCPDEQEKYVKHDVMPNSSCSPDGGEESNIHLSGMVNILQSTDKMTKRRTMKTEWIKWAKTAADLLVNIFHELHQKQWSCKILHIEHVKSYAPHMDHIVVDVQCEPNS